MADTCYTPKMLSVEEALNNIFTTLDQDKAPLSAQTVPLIDAVGRVLASDIVSNLDAPPCDNSAMDGYALRAEDLAATDTLVLVGKAFAGQPFPGEVGQGECIRIMTGAPMPKGANCVVMQENASASEKDITFAVKPPAHDNVRAQGENIAIGDQLIKAGTILDASTLALIASLGKAQVEVYRRLTVGVMATGDELKLPGESLELGQIYESNRIMVMALLKQFGAEVIDFGIIEDDPLAIKRAMMRADEACDLVITSGGVSVGEADFVKSVLDEIGQIDFWKVAIKPGKPFAFGRLANAWFCGLPGNPVSSYVTCQQLVLPMLMALQNQSSGKPLMLNATASGDIRKRPGRKDFQRGIYTVNAQGEILAAPNGPQGSGIMTSVANANCYIVLDESSGRVKKGEAIKIMPFDSLIS